MIVPNNSNFSDELFTDSCICLPYEETSSYISNKHLEEWVVGSGVSEIITRANIKTLTNKKEIADHLDWKKYTHTDGWWCSGINPRNGSPMGMMHGQFKPDTPLKFPNSHKPAKYLSSKAQYDAICLRMSDKQYWAKIIQNIFIAIFITEGCKKAGAGLTHGYHTLALCGVEMGLCDGKLVSHLALFAKPGRLTNLCFDSDIVRKIEVRKALLKLAKELHRQGCIVRIVIWEESRGKGMDDFLLANGKEEFEIEIAKAQSIEEFENNTEDNKSQKSQNKLPEQSSMAEKIAPQLINLKFDSTISRWLQYKDGYWRIANKELVLKIVSEKIKKLYPNTGFSASYLEGCGKMLISEFFCHEWPEHPKKLIPFINGVWDLETNKFIQHSPNYYFRSIINREHDINSKDWSLIEEWLDFIFENNSNQKKLLLCWYAAVLRGMWQLHRFALIIGLAGTGKSVAMKLATYLVSKHFTHSLTLSCLNNNKFQLASIYNKRLVCINDADLYRGNIEIFKNITGGDEISVEQKYENSFMAIYTGMVMVTANHFVFNMNDSGLDRRRIIFQFNRPAPKIDPDFSAKLSTQISGFTNYLLSISEEEITDTLIKKVDHSGIIRQNELEYLLETNSVADWLNNNYIYCPSSKVAVGNGKDTKDELYADYLRYCQKTSSRVFGLKEFSPEIIRLGRGKLEKKKVSSGFVICGLKRDNSGGFIEHISNNS